MEAEKKEKIHKISGIVLKLIKVFIFCSLIATAAVIYNLGFIAWGNDILLTAGLLVALNKLDNIGK